MEILLKLPIKLDGIEFDTYKIVTSTEYKIVEHCLNHNLPIFVMSIGFDDQNDYFGGSSENNVYYCDITNEVLKKNMVVMRDQIGIDAFKALYGNEYYPNNCDSLDKVMTRAKILYENRINFVKNPDFNVPDGEFEEGAILKPLSDYHPKTGNIRLTSYR
jgi:hypothetical protein